MTRFPDRSRASLLAMTFLRIIFGDRTKESRKLELEYLGVFFRDAEAGGAFPVYPEDAFVESVAASVEIALVLGAVKPEQLGFPAGSLLIKR